MYQALYRKWRPKTFADVVGQEHITQTLRRQVAEGRTSHAYLFTGTRGTGKTTCAKILAKAVNCEHPVGGDPCGCCPSCLAIDAASTLDVAELDAASNNGVDNVRALRSDAIYPPAQLKMRVYIIDEVHMLSMQAFNALLKILEEPPAHLLFILATTELHKVPATILSRCQRFSFRRILPADVAVRLQTVAQAEGIDLRPDGAELLSRLADGALRDGLSLLDQCAAAGGAVDAASVLDCLGLAGGIRTAQLMEYVLRRDAPRALALLGELYADGKDMGALLGELSSLARDLLILATAPQGGAGLLSGAFDPQTMQRLGTLTSAAQLIRLCSVLQETAAALPLSVNRRTDAELCLLRLCDDALSGDLTALCARISRLEDQFTARAAYAASAPVSAPVVEAPSADEVSDAPDDSPPWDETPPPPDEQDAPPPPIPEPTPEQPTAPPASVSAADDLFAQLLETYKNQLPPPKRAFLNMADGVLENGVLTVYCGSELQKSMLDAPEVVEVLRSVTARTVGSDVSVRFLVGKCEHGGKPTDPMQGLLRRGSKLSNFTVKQG